MIDMAPPKILTMATATVHPPINSTLPALLGLWLASLLAADEDWAGAVPDPEARLFSTSHWGVDPTVGS